MPWFRVDDNLAFHHKVVAAGNPAIGLWARAGSLCSQQLTDGFVPDHMIGALGTVAQAKRLVAVGLWDRVEGGYKFHDWEERQPSKASVEAERAAAQERMRAYRAKRKGVSQTGSSQVSEPRSGEHNPNERGTNAEVRDVFADPNPALPIPALPDPPKYAAEVDVVEGELVPDEPLTSQALVAEWINHCNARPPKSVIGQVSKHVKSMLDEGIEFERVRSGLAEWNRKGVHPSVLPSVVHEVSNKQPRPGGRTEEWRSMQERQMARALEREREMGLHG